MMMLARLIALLMPLDAARSSAAMPLMLDTPFAIRASQRAMMPPRCYAFIFVFAAYMMLMIDAITPAAMPAPRRCHDAADD